MGIADHLECIGYWGRKAAVGGSVITRNQCVRLGWYCLLIDHCRIPWGWSNTLSVKGKCVGPRPGGQAQAKRIGSGFPSPASRFHGLEFVRSDTAQANLHFDPTRRCKRNLIDSSGHQFLRTANE